MNRTMRPTPGDVVSITTPAAGPTRRIHPLPLGAAIATSGIYAAIGLMLTLNLYGFVFGVPLLALTVIAMVLLGRHRDPRATHPAWPFVITTGASLVIGVTAASDGSGWGLIAAWFIVAGLNTAIAVGLWQTTTLWGIPDPTTGRIEVDLTPERPSRRIRPLALIFGILLAVFDTLYGLLAAAFLDGIVIGLPLLIGGIAQLLMLGRHSDPTSTHPAAITGCMALAGLLGSALVLMRWGVTPVATFSLWIYATHVVIAAALWFATTVTDTTGQG